jgi:DNA repair protein RadD
MDPTVVERVAELVIDRGRLTKAEVLLNFEEISPDEYGDLRKEILSRHKDRIDSGPRKIGGFIAHYKRRGHPTVALQEAKTAEIKQEEWEASAAERLVDILDHSTLEDLLSDLKSVLRRLREVETGVDRRGTKRELADALLIAHGRDLLSLKPVREALGKQCGVKVPGNWHSGKEAAIEFTAACGLPAELIGILAPEREPDFEVLTGRLSLPPLLDFQADLKTQIIDRLHHREGTRFIATLPTGAGKTRVAVEALHDWLRPGSVGSAVWLAHTDELCDQACQCFKEVWQSSEQAPDVNLIRYWGRYSADVDKNSEATSRLLDRPSVVVSTPVRLRNTLLSGDGFGDALLRQVTVTVTDEAHRAGAPTYREIHDYITGVKPTATFVGLTATPFRTEYRADSDGVEELKQVFTEVVEPDLGGKPRQALQDIGVLSALEVKSESTDLSIALPSSLPDAGQALTIDDEQAIDDQLRAVADRPARRLAILPHVLSILRESADASVLYFGPSVNDAQAMTFMLRSRGIRAAFVGAATRTATRRQVIGDFKRGELQVLCNCEVLTTGFDAPRVSHIVMARPTVSRVLWEQIIGRGLRGERFGGTSRCVVLDFMDSFSGDPGKVDGFLSYREAWRQRLVSN